MERSIAEPVLRVHLEPHSFQELLAQVHRHGRQQALQLEFLRRDAPAEMMQALFGVGAKEYAALRRLVQAPSAVGRPEEADDAQVRAVSQAFERLARPSGRLEPQHWLRLTEETGIPLRTLWRLARQWGDGPPIPIPAAERRGEG